MLRTVIKRFICTAFYPFSTSSEREPYEKYSLQIIRNTVQKYKCYFYNNDGYPTKEVQSVFNTTVVGGVTGFLTGGLLKASTTIETFKAENQATLFKNKFEPKKQLQYKIAVNMLKGGLPVGAKLGMLCFIFSSISTYLYMYRGKFDPMNHIIGGAVTGFIYRIHMGWKGVVAGTGLGIILGTVSGIMTILILYISGKEMDDIYAAGHRLMIARRMKIKEGTKALMQEEQQALRQVHEQVQITNEE